jgi:hypothetical protein
MMPPLNVIRTEDFDPKYGDRFVTGLELAMVVTPWVIVAVLEVAALYFFCCS